VQDHLGRHGMSSIWKPRHAKVDLLVNRHCMLLLHLRQVCVCDEGVSDWWIIEHSHPMGEA
jgi:hypothetical protein